MITYKEMKTDEIDLESIFTLYQDANWTNYLKDKPSLIYGLKASLLIIGAFENEKLLGFIRVIGDGFTIIYIQDIIVLSDFQRQGIGRNLVQLILEKYKKVRQKVLLTDNSQKQIQFYKSLDFQKTEGNNLVCFTYFV